MLISNNTLLRVKARASAFAKAMADKPGTG
jgi:hypothetical protein